jgi:hypothetical protein
VASASVGRRPPRAAHTQLLAVWVRVSAHISHCGATLHLFDQRPKSCGLSPSVLQCFLRTAQRLICVCVDAESDSNLWQHRKFVRCIPNQFLCAGLHFCSKPAFPFPSALTFVALCICAGFSVVPVNGVRFKTKPIAVGKWAEATEVRGRGRSAATPLPHLPIRSLNRWDSGDVYSRDPILNTTCGTPETTSLFAPTTARSTTLMVMHQWMQERWSTPSQALAALAPTPEPGCRATVVKG